MELDRHICTQMIEKSKSYTQISLDDDYIIRDNKPDVIRVIYSQGDIFIEDVKAGNQGVWISGKLRFSVLYQSDDENHRLESVNGEVPFQEKIIMDEIKESDEITVDMEIEDLTVGIINSRKIGICAVVHVSARNLEEVDEALTCQILDKGYEQKKKELSILCLQENKKEMLRIQKEMILPNSKSNIGEITFYQVDFRNEEILLQEDSVQIKMDGHIWVLYRSESTGEYECYETVVPLSGEIETDSLRGDEIFWATIKTLEAELEPRGDYDGENRMLGLDVMFSVEVQIYREESCEILQDAYALEKELLIEKKQVPMHQLLMKNVSKVRLMEQEAIEPNQQRILQICGSSGSVSIDRVKKRENGVQVEGVLNVHILYNTTDDAMPFAHTSSQILFEQFLEIDGFDDTSTFQIRGTVEQLQVNLLDNTEYEIKAAIQIGILALHKEYLNNIDSIDEEEIDAELLQKQPGMIGYVRKEGEDLWDVAKKYHASTENMIEIADKVLIIKQVH
ncbi:MAG: DUF3794 domain-containing protein [Agathobacter sp.]|nr:DUF3794 domain-containing protein [Agathobacter sp.]